MKEDFKMLYANSYFNMIWLMVTAILSMAYPRWGAVLAAAYFLGWVAFAKKHKDD